MKDSYSDKIVFKVNEYFATNLDRPDGILMNNKDVKKWKKQLIWVINLDELWEKDIYFMGIKIYRSKDIKKGTVKVF